MAVFVGLRVILELGADTQHGFGEFDRGILHDLRNTRLSYQFNYTYAVRGSGEKRDEG